MVDDEWDWDGDPVDLDACDVTGDGQLDQQGYQSPQRVPRTWARPQSEDRDWLPNARRDRARREAKWEEARWRRESAPSHEIVAWPREMDYGPGMGPLRPGRLRYRVDVTPGGRTTWTPVDQPGDGPQMTVQQSPAPQWHPVELTEPWSRHAGVVRIGPGRTNTGSGRPAHVAESN
jgi:hypothetical protein